MAIFKCKMCGGALEINNNETVAVCEYCGTKQTLPKLDDEKRVQLYDRANHFRRENEFDKAMGIYEMILSDDKEDSESYWGIVLCRYGIEYVEDPRTHKRIPTVNRAQFTSIFDDEDYQKAIQYADGYQREIYEAEAGTIDKIQKGILAISQKEEPFDVFICYKETDRLGNRTQDSVYAQDIYTALTKEGYKVFFSRITLEDKLGSAYEPYIFAALNSAKVMLVVGTEKDNFNAVWVKNEWSRFLNLIKAGKEKTLIPVYKDITPYDMPEEFQYLQSQDMAKIGFMQDLVRGVSKLVAVEKKTETIVINSGNTNVAPLLKRAFMFLEDGDWNSADEYCEKVLDVDPECAVAYIGKLMVELRVRKQEDLNNCQEPFDDSNFYQKALRFADKETEEELKGYIEKINVRNENARIQRIYASAKGKISTKSDEVLMEAVNEFKSIIDYKDSRELAEEYSQKAQVLKNERLYNIGISLSKRNDIYNLNSAIRIFSEISDYNDSQEQLRICREKLSQLKKAREEERLKQEQIKEQMRLEKEKLQEKERLEKEKLQEKERKAKKRKIVIKNVIAVSVAAAILFSILFVMVIKPKAQYNKAINLKEQGEYEKAIEVFTNISEEKDSAAQIIECYYLLAEEAYENGELRKAAICYGKAAVRDEDAATKSKELWDTVAVRETISAGNVHTVGLNLDGTVVAVGDTDYAECEVTDWTDIVAIAAGNNCTVGLKSDGTVVATGSSDSGVAKMYHWTNIVAIAAGGHIVALKSDGTVVAVGNNDHDECTVSDWTDIVAIAAGNDCTVGLKSDGTVVTTGVIVSSSDEIYNWSDIVAISAGAFHTVGLKSDGTVVATGNNYYGQCDVYDWTDIVAISAGGEYTVGLKSDGTVVVTGDNSNGQCDVNDWTDIVAISADYGHTVGLKSDGTVVATGYNYYGQCDVSDWKNIKEPKKK